MNARLSTIAQVTTRLKSKGYKVTPGIVRRHAIFLGVRGYSGRKISLMVSPFMEANIEKRIRLEDVRAYSDVTRISKPKA